jgi:hypothetical protein
MPRKLTRFLLLRLLPLQAACCPGKNAGAPASDVAAVRWLRDRRLNSGSPVAIAMILWSFFSCIDHRHQSDRPCGHDSQRRHSLLGEYEHIERVIVFSQRLRNKAAICGIVNRRVQERQDEPEQKLIHLQNELSACVGEFQEAQDRRHSPLQRGI